MRKFSPTILPCMSSSAPGWSIPVRKPFQPCALYQDSAVSLPNLYGLPAKIREACGKRVWLKSGGYLVIEPTEALTVIDVQFREIYG